jgi:DNA-binding beta-propeller fold protein YncE
MSVIDTQAEKVVREIRPGDKLCGLAVSRDGKKPRVSDQRNTALVIIDLEKLAPIDGFFLGESA